jgi:hypothetical protein
MSVSTDAHRLRNAGTFCEQRQRRSLEWRVGRRLLAQARDRHLLADFKEEPAECGISPVERSEV